jgi:FkbM family methyltransferase
VHSRSVITRTVLSLFRILRNEGMAGLFAKVRRKTRIWLVCFAARGVKSVTFDGCVFALDMIPNNAIKVSLLKQKYERFERHAVLQYIRPEYPVVELGACIGVVSCVTNRILKNPASHVVVEANPRVIPILENNRNSNHCEFEILNQALVYDLASVTFSPASDFRGTSLRENVHHSFEIPSVTVPTTGLGAIVTPRGYDRFTLICDIEGHEYELVNREPHILERVDTLILETHARLIGEAKHSEMMRKLAELGFRTIDQDSFVVVMRRTAPSPTEDQGA